MAVLSKYFSDQDLAEIKEAVKQAESKTSGEIVPYFAEASHHYKEYAWQVAFLGGALGGFALFIQSQFVDSSWGEIPLIYAILYIWTGSLIGLVLGTALPILRKLFISNKMKSFYVNLRAKEAFLNEEVFRTKDRTGILIYISFFEKIVRVLPDVTISKIVPQSDWNEAVRLIIDGMKSGNKRAGIVASILFCGNLLTKYGVEIQKNDQNELSDEIRDGGTLL
ncbi:hypothetical protein LPTSP4_23240 [Leptospira ryugenii]|uniref:TPM domain-containing protein n=1 Tax=Leptospira ryugenii TaxID=1917863 RepID=A0A2P2E1N8_9LEPT|nr:hypothetical protein [Leptospira ryugenii]GBF50797.1 hypothetical protein LPTSP4_23240 [Leptospira ryugenii]